MKISRNWLNNYIISKKSDDELIDEFTQLGLECTVEHKNLNFPNIVVGKVESCTEHPNADKLKVCEVNIGKETLQIVCGATNIKENIMVPVAKVGAEINTFKIKKTKIRNVVSNGMICSGKELGLNDEHEGIMILNNKFKEGSNLNVALELSDDSIFNFDITPNRGDCFSHLGIARELSILENKKINIKLPDLQCHKFKTSELIEVDIKDDNICKRYACRIVKNIKVKDSPQWLQNKLNSIDQKCVNNIVDLANYLMFDLGQPLHIFDYDKINNKKINIRLAKNNEKIICLNNDTKKLSNEDIIIADSKGPIAIAGVIGSFNTQVDNNTKNILIESAIFNEINIRKTSKKHDYVKEASKRFERGLDCNNILFVIDRFCELLLDITRGEVAEDFLDLYKHKLKSNTISFSSKKCNEFLGTSLTNDQVNKIFTKLSIKYSNDRNNYVCSVPTFRNDLTTEVDLYEEVARVYGYNKISSNTSFTFPVKSFVTDEEILDHKIRTILSNHSFNEHYSNSLYSKDDSLIESKYKPIEIINPLSQDMMYLRNSLLPGLLRSLSFNEKRNENYVKLFELGNITSYNNNNFNKSKQHKQLMMVWMGSQIDHWKHPIIQDFYTVKGEINYLLDMLNIKDFYLKSDKGSTTNIFIKNKNIGYLKLIDENIKNKFDLIHSVYVCSIDLDLLKLFYANSTTDYYKIYSFPSITRDISILLNVKFNNEEIERVIFKNSGDKLTRLNLFDLYEGNKLPKNSKSMAYSLTFQSNKETLTDKEIDNVISKIIAALVDQFGAIQR